MSKPSTPITEVMPRPGRGTNPPSPTNVPLEWTSIEEALSGGQHPVWLTTTNEHGVPHVVPVFAAWDGQAFFVATKSTARKTRDLLATGRCVLAFDTGEVHLVVECSTRRATSEVALQRAVAAFNAVYGWPTTVVGDELDAPFAAPTSGGPPLQAWEMLPTIAFGFVADGVSAAPTRWRFGTP